MHRLDTAAWNSPTGGDSDGEEPVHWRDSQDPLTTSLLAPSRSKSLHHSNRSDVEDPSPASAYIGRIKTGNGSHRGAERREDPLWVSFSADGVLEGRNLREAFSDLPVSYNYIASPEFYTEHETRIRPRDLGPASDLTPAEKHVLFMETTPTVTSEDVKYLKDFTKELELAGEYRSGYTNWRQGGTKGAHGEISKAYQEAEKTKWVFRSTVSYWTCVTFVWGSWVFTAASALWYSKAVFSDVRHNEFAAVSFPYFLGAALFTVGCYAGYFEVINSDARQAQSMGAGDLIYGPVSWAFCKQKGGITAESYVGAVSYLAGSLLYNVGTLFGCDFMENLYAVPPVDKILPIILASSPNVIGGVCFAIGGAMEMKINNFFSFDFQDIGWWVSFFNGGGGFLFFVGGLADCFVPRFSRKSDAYLNSVLITITPYFIGSLMYFLGSTLLLWMWKSDQFGLGLMRWMNRHTPSHLHRKVGRKQFAVMMVAILCASGCVMNVSVTLWRCRFYHLSQHDTQEMALNGLALSLLGVVEMTAIFVLFSFMHRTPKFKPLHRLMQLARLWIVLRCLYEWWTLFANLTLAQLL